MLIIEGDLAVALMFFKRIVFMIVDGLLHNSQYEFSEQFLNKNKYYYGMILSEHRHPSIDALHYLIKSISELSETESNTKRLDDLYEEGHTLITKRLLKSY